jgi:WXG100 family type VII secretion target
MTTYTVNMSNVQEVAEQMGVLAGKISDALTNLEGELQSTLAEWTSSARDAYNTCKAKWDAAAAQMATQAVNAQNSLSQIQDQYANAEFQGLGLWGQ